MAWFFPIVKVVLPYIAPVVSAALPAFTKKKDEAIDPLLAQQIAELQQAARTSTESAKVIAKAVEEAAKANDKANRQARWIALAALAASLISLAIALAIFARQ